MERKISEELLKWKIDDNKKPMLLYGISGCGKTYTILDFGKKEYKNTIYFDCNNNLELNYVFEKNSSLEKLIKALSAISLETIFKEESLIVFDNVNEKIFKLVKKLFINSSYDIVMITSNEKFLTGNKAGEISLKKMNLVTFPEYLKFIGKEQLIDFIEDSFRNNKPMPFHSLAIEVYNDYVISGGYPSTIINFHKENDYNILSSYHDKSILYIKDNLIESDNSEIKKGIEVFNSISFQLLKENKKFLYGLVKPGGRGKDYENIISYMEKNHLIIKSSRINAITSPLSKCREEDNFKLYYNDSGILYKKMNVNSNRLLTNEKLLETIYENNVVSVLSQNGFNVYNYHATGGKCEIDIVIQNRNGLIIPIEIYNKDMGSKSKSLGMTMAKYNLKFAIRLSNQNFSLKNKVKYIPYYAVFCIGDDMFI